MTRTLQRAGVVVGVAALIALAGPGRAAGADVNVNPFFGCFLSGGIRSVPAGSTIVIRQGQALANRGLTEAYLNAVTTVLVVNSVPVAETDSLYRDGPIGFPDGSWQTRFIYPSGITLQSGQSLTFSYDEVVSHPVHDGFTVDEEHPGYRPLFGDPGSMFGGPINCTVTAT